MPRYALAQINVTVGDLRGNAETILDALHEAATYAPDLVIFPELTLAGYPPEDLLLKPGFFRACDEVLQDLVPEIDGRVLLGAPLEIEGERYNAALLIRAGAVEAVYRKNLLPNYSVFDEERYFAAGEDGLVFEAAGQTVGAVICEDAWEPDGPARDEARCGARAVACLSASPYHRNKSALREETFRPLCRRNGVWFLYCNLVGGQDELVFDGGSLIMNPDGKVVARGREFEEDLLVMDLPDLPPRIAGQADAPGCGHTCRRAGTGEDEGATGCACAAGTPAAERPALPPRSVEKLEPLAELYGALVLGVRDYVRKNRFGGVIVGLSGGIDSALTAALAADALGPENVLGVTLPSRYSSDATRSDAEILARNLGIRFETLPVEPPHRAFLEALDPLFADLKADPENLTDQNLQARIRAVYLMALANRFGRILLNTSNKSESAVGYGTLYGDMAGGYAAIRDVFKTRVWKLARHVNAVHGREVIPESTIDRVPTAELRADQEDRQSIPDYPVLDPILELYVEQDRVFEEIVEAGHDPATVRQVIDLVDRNEFKRRQSVIGPRVTPKAFGKDRRLPITNRFAGCAGPH